MTDRTPSSGLPALGASVEPTDSSGWHVVYCRGCQRAWSEGPGPGLAFDPPPDGDCACVCDPDSGDYENWVVDPDPADIPEGAWTR